MSQSKKQPQEPTNRDILQAVQSIDQRLIGVDQRVIGMDKRLTGVEEKLTGVDDRLTSVDDRLITVEDRLTMVDDRLTGHIEESKQTHGDILQAINSYANDIESELSNIKTQRSLDMLEMKTAVSKINTRLNSLPTKDYLDEKMADLRGDVVGSQKRTNKIESYQ